MKTTLKRPVAIIGYSGHAYVIIDIFLNAGRLVTAYCDAEEKLKNPYHLKYLGKESDALDLLSRYDYFKVNNLKPYAVICCFKLRPNQKPMKQIF